MSKPIIAVFGATGAQGAGLARAAGAEVMFGDIDDARGTAATLAGACGAFLGTHSGEPGSVDRELRQVRVLAAAAAQAGVRHVIWSTLATGEPDRLLSAGVWQSILPRGLGPPLAAVGRLTLVFPAGGAHSSWTGVASIGMRAHEVLLRAEALIGDGLANAGKHHSGAQIAAQWTAAFAETVHYQPAVPAPFAVREFKREAAPPPRRARPYAWSAASHPHMPLALAR